MIKIVIFKATTILRTLPVIWKLMLSDIPLPVVNVLTHLSGGCYVNVILIYIGLTLIRFFIYKKFEWFAILNETYVALAINLIALIIEVIIRLYVQFYVYAYNKYTGYTLFLTSEIDLRNTEKFPNTPILPFIIIAISLVVELYISFKVKSCFTSLSVAIGHLYMIVCMFLIFTANRIDPLFESVQISFTTLSCQMLYILKYETYFLGIVRNTCMIDNNQVNSVIDDNLNDFGIYVGPQLPNSNE